MSSLLQIFLLALATCLVVPTTWSLWRQARRVKASGLPHRFSPVHVMNVAYWFLLAPIVVLDRYVPLERLQKWLPWTSIFRVWQSGHKIFEEIGSDSFFFCSPSGSMLMTCDVDLVQQVLGRGQDFHAPVEVLQLYNLYGPTLAASEGEQWRLYRKITTPFFNDKTFAVVWKESLLKAERVAAQWSRQETRITDVKAEVMSKLNLRVIAKTFYNQELGYDQENAMKDVAPSGHSLSFSEAINAVLSNLATIFGLPHWLLAKSPFLSHQRAYLGFIEWGKYMHEMRHSVKSQLSTSNKQPPYFLESLVVSSDTAPKQRNTRSLTDAEVIGNMFFYVMAGFDTTSTTLSFVFLLLALHPPCQILLQQELDRVLGSKSPTEWDLEKDVRMLLHGYLGAVISETLRLYHPVAWYARKAVRETAVTASDGKSHKIPANTIVMIDIAAIGRHKGYWKSKEAYTASGERSPALDFDPSRWLEAGGQEAQKNKAAFPFSSGRRMCPGKRFAEVEMCAMVARFFVQFSLRLEHNVSDVTDARLAGHGQKWLDQRTRGRAAKALFDGLGFGHGIYPRSHVPFKVIPRGSE